MARREPNVEIVRAATIPTTAGIVATIPTTVEKMRITDAFIISSAALPGLVSVWLLPASGGTTANLEASLRFKRMGVFQTLNIDEIIGQFIEGGGTIRAESDLLNSFAITVSGTSYPLGYA